MSTSSSSSSVTMSKQDVSEQVRFLVSCIRNATSGKPDFAAVATELEIVSKAAAQKRYERLLKAHDINGTKAAAPKPDEDGDVTPTPQSTPKKRKTPRKAATGPKKKAKAAVKGEASGEDEKAKAQLVKKEEKEDDSALSDPPASDGEVDI
ncbi:Uncharacterized protein TPAR_05647 [Tolypocladium paradoxum]|uniref:Myb-like DNA-binding domain-containing protein n=1 Tax=Tolypocladium paradoxum TaxID=94208 RepID=A0A2S4KVB9_9HYPO|nr:Uncharacterized protein TPAR_05647 [Tolypocladium paradoxum]